MFFKRGHVAPNSPRRSFQVVLMLQARSKVPHLSQASRNAEAAGAEDHSWRSKALAMHLLCPRQHLAPLSPEAF